MVHAYDLGLIGCSTGMLPLSHLVHVRVYFSENDLLAIIQYNDGLLEIFCVMLKFPIDDESSICILGNIFCSYFLTVNL